MYNEYVSEDYESESGNKKRFSFRINKLLIIFLIIVVVIGVVIYLNTDSYFESKMVRTAKKYVSEKYISTDSEIYMTLQELGLSRDKCDDIRSGVFFNKDGNYQAYLNCDKYQTDIMHNNASFQLKGAEVFFLAKGVNFVDPGIVGDYEYKTDGIVGNEPGVYQKSYEFNGEIINRKIVVIENDYLRSFFPTITLNGDRVVYVLKNMNYKDAGIKAYDTNDGDITDKVVIDNNVNVNASGEYYAKYTITNSRGYSNMVERTIVVVNNFSNTMVTTYKDNNNLTNSDVIINISIIGDNYEKVLLPNGEETSQKEISYPVKENGVYNFIAFDNDGKKVIKTLAINNIDKTPPTGMCTAMVYTNYVDIKATSTSPNKTISGYKYYVDDKATDFYNTNTYKFSYTQTSEKVKVNVEIKDSIGNTNKMDCVVSYSDPTIGNNKVKYYKYNGVEYVIPNTKNTIDDLVRRTQNKISQSADSAECGGKCLSFAIYHAGFLAYGNLNYMNLDDACHYRYGSVVRAKSKYFGTSDANRKEMFAAIYKEIFEGRPVVLQVTGTKARNSRHFVTVVGYKRSIKSGSALEEEDLLVVDSWNGGFKTLSRADHSKRTCFNDTGRGGGYRLDFISPR